MGYDLSLTRAPIEPIRRVLGRACGTRVIRSSTPAKAIGPIFPICRRTSAGDRERIGAGIGDPGPCGRILVRGEPGWEIISELAPEPGEPIIDKPGKGSFYATDLELLLHRRGIKNMILTGITTDVCVHTTMRDANDRGFECLLLEDCCGATDARQPSGSLENDHHARGRVRRRRSLRRLFWRFCHDPGDRSSARRCRSARFRTPVSQRQWRCISAGAAASGGPQPVETIRRIAGARPMFR